MKIKIGKLLGKLKGISPLVALIAPKAVPPVAAAIEVAEAVDAVDGLLKKKRKP